MDSSQHRQLARLQQENEQLKNDCDSQKSSLEALEEMFAETSKKQLQAEISCMELEHIFASVTDAIWVIRDDGIIVRANDAMLELIGLPAEQVIGHDCHQFLDYGLCHTDSCPLRIAENPQRKELDITIETATGQTRHFILNAAPMTTIIGTTAIISQFKDITCRKVAEKKLEEANRALSKMARLDGLTQVANRRCFDETLKVEWHRLRRSEQPLALIMIDIDYFKKYNDHYGHQAGDDCLIAVARALQASVLRPADLVARYGGEEFAILLPEVDLKGALHVGNRAAEELRRLRIPHAASEVAGIITMSMGAAAMIPHEGKNVSDLIADADKALYAAKAQGRNRMVLQV